MFLQKIQLGRLYENPVFKDCYAFQNIHQQGEKYKLPLKRNRTLNR
jgi:hypothetical protein